MDQTSWKKLYPVEHVLIPALKAGASGLVVGGAAGILRSSTPGLFAIASGLQCAALGTTFYATRGAILQAWQITASSPPQDRIYPSTLAGGITGGTIGGLTRGRANIIPGIIMFSVFGFAGQHLYNALDANHQLSLTNQPTTDALETPTARPLEPRWRRMLNSRWSPMKVLSDEEYEQLLKEKLVRVEAELAMVEDNIEEIQQKARDGEKADGKDGTH
ncbi:MAG: hypothetical protein L6R40_007227 [Gallowayella cf. fulva]|nr:MAG: hypothetical protein L6R40_007227 [Xanthomendoza cf. fulva]